MLQEITKPILLQDLGMMYATEKSKNKHRFGLYKCKCGNEFKAETQCVKNGNTNSCGCYQKERASKIKHNLRNHRIYTVWVNMKQRCFNKNSTHYINYGGRGITIYNEWLSDFKAFYDWAMSNGYEEHLTIDRIDVNGNYEPSNCRWATREVQSRNTRVLRKDNNTGYRGVTFTDEYRRYRAMITIKQRMIHLGSYDTALDAAKAYNKYVIDNNLEHTLNII